MQSASAGQKPVVLTLLGAYWPGNDAAGPNQSFKGLATALKEQFDFLVVARDRAFGADKTAASTGRWVDCGFARFCYCDVSPLTGAIALGEIMRSTPHDLVMMNGFFDREFTLPALAMRHFGHVPRKPTIVSARGEFGSGALGLKSLRKNMMLTLTRRAGLHRDVWLHATGPAEAADIARGYPHSKGVVVAPNVRVLGPLPPRPERARQGAELRLAFVGRISRVKNLDYAIRTLRDVRTPVTYDIFGPVQDADYWAECQKLIAALPAHVSVRLKGEAPNEEMTRILAGYDLFYLPTKGENFGHAILDALEAGTPVLISDQTPFRNLEAAQAGYDLPLEEPARFSAAIDAFGGKDPETQDKWRSAARAAAERTVQESDARSRNLAMLKAALRQIGD
ncbi:glycosyltransferase [Methylocystis sp. SC2]|uniref:glycosyltransferase n=1 Tax=Methylocystis sp. (strain SC2) TaxID=187303 RepID=UPI00027AF3CC|nr:glycosyltransferase [Methylocystis sp. SC2]CCJ07827.1 Glycosyl transferase group 1 [Methylocystis sp. SC2]